MILLRRPGANTRFWLVRGLIARKQPVATVSSGSISTSVSDFADTVDTLGHPRTLLDGVPCRDRTYDQLIKRSLHGYHLNL